MNVKKYVVVSPSGFDETDPTCRYWYPTVDDNNNLIDWYITIDKVKTPTFYSKRASIKFKEHLQNQVPSVKLEILFI